MNSNIKVCFSPTVFYKNFSRRFCIGNPEIFLTNQTCLLISLFLTAFSSKTFIFLITLMHPIYFDLPRKTLDGQRYGIPSTTKNYELERIFNNFLFLIKSVFTKRLKDTFFIKKIKIGS